MTNLSNSLAESLARELAQTVQAGGTDHAATLLIGILIGLLLARRL
jgi:hypothetical protein